MSLCTAPEAVYGDLKSTTSFLFNNNYFSNFIIIIYYINGPYTTILIGYIDLPRKVNSHQSHSSQVVKNIFLNYNLLEIVDLYNFIYKIEALSRVQDNLFIGIVDLKMYV